jgi:hypothetical protein
MRRFDHFSIVRPPEPGEVLVVRRRRHEPAHVRYRGDLVEDIGSTHRVKRVIANGRVYEVADLISVK